MIVAALALTALLAFASGMAPAWLARRAASRRDAAWAAGLWAGVWLFCLCAYHRPGLTVGFDGFRLLAIAALCGWAGFCTAGLRAFGRRGLRFVLPLLLAVAAGAELFVGNVAYFNTHSYQPFQLMDYLDSNVNVERGNGTWSLEEGRAYLRFLAIDRPIYNLQLDNLTNDDTDPLHADSTFTFDIEGTDDANGVLIRFGTWQVGTQAPRSQVISLDLTGNVDSLVLQASGYSTAHTQYPVAFTVTGITANAPRALALSPLRFGCILLALLAGYALRPGSGLWRRRWLAGSLCDRMAALVLGGVLAAFVVVVPFWQPGNTGLATESYNTAYWDGESTVSFVYQQYGALAHSLLNGRLDLEEDPPEALLALENPYDAAARDAANIQGGRWDHALYNGRIMSISASCPACCSAPVRGHHRHPEPCLRALHGGAGAGISAQLFWHFGAGGAAVVPHGVVGCVFAVRGGAGAGQPAVHAAGAAVYLRVCHPVRRFAADAGAVALAGGGRYAGAARRRAGAAAGGGQFVRGAGRRLPPADGTVRIAGAAHFLAPLWYAPPAVQPRRRAGRRRVFAAVVLVAAGLMWYNAARFGSPFDFGANYNLTGNDMTQRGFNVVRIGPAVFTSLFDLPRLQSVFPFLQEVDVQTNAVIRTISERFCGGMLAATPFTWALALPAVPLARRSLHRRRAVAAVVYGSLAGMAAITVVDCQMAGVLYRYLMDYSPVLLLGARCAGCWPRPAFPAVRKAARRWPPRCCRCLRAALAAALAWGVFYRFATLFAMEPWLRGMNPSLYYTASRLVQFWM